MLDWECNLNKEGTYHEPIFDRSNLVRGNESWSQGMGAYELRDIWVLSQFVLVLLFLLVFLLGLGVVLCLRVHWSRFNWDFLFLVGSVSLLLPLF